MKDTTNEKLIVRSSSVEYLTFIAATGEGGVDAIYANETIWITQKMMGVLYDVETHTVNYHLKKVFSDSELEEDSVIRNFRITAKDGKTYNTKHYNLAAIIAVGYKVNSERAVQFRRWATQIVEEFTIKGFAMDDERLKNDGTILGKKYFEEQLQRIREIRLSERKFYQKITDTFNDVELINDSPLTAPSKRLESCITGYDKIVYGTIIAETIGLHRIREKCGKFNEWITKLEKLELLEGWYKCQREYKSLLSDEWAFGFYSELYSPKKGGRKISSFRLRLFHSNSDNCVKSL